jgi:hypothetical protein
MANGLPQIPWEEVGAEEGKRLISTSHELSLKIKDGLAGVSAPGIPDFEARPWRYEFCIFRIFRMFWIWYVANSPKLTNAGATKPLLDAHHRSSYHAMVRAGLLEDSESDLRVWGAISKSASSPTRLRTSRSIHGPIFPFA